MADNSLATDADPEPPRSTMNEQTADQPQSSLEETALGRQIQRDTRIPTEVWKFKHFLVKLANEITESDLEQLNYLFSGVGGIGQGLLSKVKSPLELFKTLEQRCWLTPDNLLSLQAALKTINRMDLVKTAADYAQSIDNVLYFYPASAQPENGNKFVKLHVRGRNYQDTTRDEIQQIRLKFAELLFAPPECILIAGIEPSTSLILTLYIPDAYIKLLQDMLKTNADQSHFKDIGVDIIQIQHVEELFRLQETEKAKTIVREQNKKLRNVYEQLENTKKQLEVSGIEQLDLRKRIKEFELESLKREAMLKSMKTNFTNNRSASCSDYLIQFEKLLQRPEWESYDKALILSLIDINTQMVATTVSEVNKLMEEKMKLAIQERDVQMLPLQFELLKSRAFSNPVIFENMILEMFQNLVKGLSVTITIDGDFLQILKKISRGLRSRDRAKLEKNYDWTPKEPLKQAMDNDSSFFLAAILHKELQKLNGQVDPELFILQCLEEVNRPELKSKFENSIASLKTARETADRKQQKRNRQRSKSLERDGDTDARMSKDQVQQMADQVAQMHKIIVSNYESIQRPSYPGFTQSTKRCSSESMDGDRFVY